MLKKIHFKSRSGEKGISFTKGTYDSQYNDICRSTIIDNNTIIGIFNDFRDD